MLTRRLRRRLTGLALMTGALPTLAAGQSSAGPGLTWLEASISRSDTRERFDFDGTRRPFFARGHVVVTTVEVRPTVALTSRLGVTAAVPVQRLDFTDEGGEEGRTAIGGTLISLVFAVSGPGAPPERDAHPRGLTVRAGVKLPSARMGVDPEIVAVGEGQRDWEIEARWRHAPRRRSWRVTAAGGFRFREADAELERDYGDESFFGLTVDAGRGAWEYVAGVESLIGLSPVLQGIRVRSARRELHRGVAAVRRRVGSGRLEGGVAVPFAGQNLPAGTTLHAAYGVAWPPG